MRSRHRSRTRLLVAGVAAVTVAVTALVGGIFMPQGMIGGPQAAAAAEGNCGQPIHNVNDLIGSDPALANKVMTDNEYNGMLGSVFGDNHMLCGAGRAVIDTVAGTIVQVIVETGTGLKWEWIATVGRLLTSQYGPDSGKPTVLPDVGPSGGYAAPVAWTGGIGLNLNRTPNERSALGTVPEGGAVTILCQEHGRFVNGGPTPSDLWDLVDYGGTVGWVADAYVNTGTPNQVAPTC